MHLILTVCGKRADSVSFWSTNSRSFFSCHGYFAGRTRSFWSHGYQCPFCMICLLFECRLSRVLGPALAHLSLIRVSFRLLQTSRHQDSSWKPWPTSSIWTRTASSTTKSSSPRSSPPPPSSRTSSASATRCSGKCHFASAPSATTCSRSPNAITE